MSKNRPRSKMNWGDVDRCAAVLKASVSGLEAGGMKPSFIAMACEDLAMIYAQQADFQDYQRHIETMVARGKGALTDLVDVMEEFRPKADS